MKTYRCVTNCFDERGRLWKTGMERAEEDSYTSSSLDRHFTLIGEINSLPKKEVAALEDSVAEFAKRHNISAAKMKSLFGGKSLAPHEKMAILVEFVEAPNGNI